MALLSCLEDPLDLLVVDTSVAINLNATGCGEEILQALPNRMVVTDAVVAELDNGREQSRQDAELFGRLVRAGLVEVVKLGTAASGTFEELVIGPGAMTLGDGEAATIAFAVDTRAVALIDERKANALCSAKFPDLRVGCTVDILAHPAVQRLLGEQRLSDAVVNALQIGRMRVLPRHLEGVVGLIGPERAAACPSLPRGSSRGGVQAAVGIRTSKEELGGGGREQGEEAEKGSEMS